MDIIEILKWVILWAVVTGAVYIVGRSAYEVISKPNLRRYLVATLKDVKNMYYRYHV